MQSGGYCPEAAGRVCSCLKSGKGGLLIRNGISGCSRSSICDTNISSSFCKVEKIDRRMTDYRAERNIHQRSDVAFTGQNDRIGPERMKVGALDGLLEKEERVS